MNKYLSILAASALLSCAPSQFDEARYGVVHWALGDANDSADPWTPDQVREIRVEMEALNALGPRFVEVEERDADVVVRPYIAETASARCGLGAGRFFPTTRFVEIDPVCTEGYDVLRKTVGHEVGHFLGMGHVCYTANEAPDCDTRVGYGVAIMNPSASYDVQFGVTTQGVTFSQDVPTELDLDEYRRTRQ